MKKKLRIFGIVLLVIVVGSVMFYALTHHNMTGAPYAEIEAYRAAHPNTVVTYEVTIDGGSAPLVLKHDSQSVTVENAAQAGSLIAQAEYLQALESVDCGDIVLPVDILKGLTEAFPNGAVTYATVPLLNRDYPSQTTVLELTGLDTQKLGVVAEALPLFPRLETLTLTAAEGTVFQAEDAAIVAVAAPDITVNMTFSLFDQEVSTDMEKVEYFKVEIGDEGLDTIRAVMPIMDKLTYLKLDWCGTTDEATAQLRDELADQCKVVWRVFMNQTFNALTDTYKIWAQFNLWGKDVECLKYCTEVRYIDMGHSYVDNCEFVKYMPYLDTLILSDSRLEDLEPLRTCKNLTYLEFFSTNVADISPLADLPQLQYLNMSNCEVDDISPIYGLDNLIIVNCTMSDISDDQIQKFQELHPNTKSTFNLYKSPTEFGWRHGPTPEGYRRTPRYALLREQIGYDTKDYSYYPYGYVTEEITYESTGITPPEKLDYEVYPK